MGVTAFVAAGDAGSSGGQNNGLAAVDFPADNPYVTAVGGTQVANGVLSDQVVWNEAPKAGGTYTSELKLGATGGGVSTLYGVPSYQAGLNPTSVNPGGGTGRGVPDVASLAGGPGFEVVEDGVATADGGTSAGGPLWAGLAAIIDQQLTAQPNGPLLGFFNSILYNELGGAGLTPITSGNNITSNTDSPNSNIYQPTGYGYTATSGWSMTTGWGTPNGEVLLGDLEDLLKNRPT
jgi:kumamolisin